MPSGRLLGASSLLAMAITAGLDVSAACSASKTLVRFHDPVIISAAALGTLPDRWTAGWRLYRVEAGKAIPIPFQFDPLKDGDVVVDAPVDFELGADDQLVFMAKDTGDRAPDGFWLPGCDAVREIEVTDPVGAGRGWSYLAHFPGAAPPPSTDHYVHYDRATNRARSAFYEVEYAPTRNYFTALKVMPPAGGDGRNLLHQTRMLGRPTFHLLFGNVALGFTEQNSIVAVDGVREGPVRAVRRVRLSVDLGRYFPELPSGTVYTHHYLTSYTTPTQMSIPWLALKTLRDFTFEEVSDFRADAMPMRYWDGANPEGVDWTARHDRPLASDLDHDWWVHSGDGGTMLHAFIVPAEWREWGIVRGTVFRGEGDLAAGYSLLNMTHLRRAGSHRLSMTDIVLLGGYAPGDEERVMEMLRSPLHTDVRPLSASIETVNGARPATTEPAAGSAGHRAASRSAPVAPASDSRPERSTCSGAASGA